MSKKIFRSVIAVALAVLLLGLAIATGFLYDYFGKAQVSRLKEELLLAAAGVEDSGLSYFDGLSDSSLRLTLVSPDGEVLYDTDASLSEMENHIDREEIGEALKYGRGSSIRYSSTLTEKTCYEALKLSDGNVLRVSATQITVATLFIEIAPAIAAVILLSVAAALFLSQKTARSIVAPLEKLDLDKPDVNETYEELTPILSRLNLQHKQILQQMDELKSKSEELLQISSSMKEGLVLLSGDGSVLGVNSAAQKLFSAENVEGKSFLSVDRSSSMRLAVEKVLSGNYAEFCEEKNGREYQFRLTPTESGAVILCLDITESAFAEKHRQEFTANVSHELKTPLQSIIGSAELLENGLVKAEDTSRFVSNIKNEATRLVALINDIIRLSQLDGKGELPTEPVDLYRVAKEVESSLLSSAEKKNVTLSVIGESCVMNGIYGYLYEAIFNLCDNAVRYNKDGGRVDVSVTKEEGRPVVRVKDSGIGIPPEHINRIFERFYRVDKSHSRETGGTGLGLSIVKHAVLCNGGTVNIESTVGVGTEVTVKF